MTVRLSDLPPHVQAQVAKQAGIVQHGHGKTRIPGAHESGLERQLDMLLRAHSVTGWVRQHPFMQYRMDFAFPARKLAVEVDGGSWVNGAHVRGKRFEHDCVRSSEMAAAGWRVIRLTGAMIDDGRAVDVITRALTYTPDPSTGTDIP